MINIFPLPDLLVGVAAFWCDLLTTEGILLRQRGRVRTAELTRDVGGAKGTLHQPLPRPRVSRMCPWDVPEKAGIDLSSFAEIWPSYSK